MFLNLCSSLRVVPGALVTGIATIQHYYVELPSVVMGGVIT